ncbi:MAG: cation transporter [Flavipsychrobacter sp.]|nr:cation transporter [Flavipsychrobacter sp.]
MHSHHHSHEHHHEGHHHHHHHTVPDVVSNAFIAGIVLNSAFVVVQAIAGFMTDSMALLSDAGHNLSDVASLALALMALRLAKVKPSHSFTYGYKKTTILAALTNAVILFITIGILGYESIQRLMAPRPVEGGTVAIVAAIGIIVNFGSAMLLFRNKEHDMNTKGAYLHLLSDGLVSVGVVVAGVLIKYTNWFWLDGAISIAILIVILVSTWSLLTASLRASMDAVPANVNIENIETLVLKVKGVESVHHLHIWAMSTTQNALTAHLVLSDQLSFDEKMKLVHQIKHQLFHNNIHHATIELESANLPCDDAIC